MAFLPYSYEGGQVPPFEYQPCAAGNLSIGLCMAHSSGKVALSVNPTYICLRQESSASAGTLIPLMHITPEITFEAPLKAASTSLKPGSLVDVAADGLSIANTNTNANVQIISMDGTAAGDLCRCRFVK